MFVDILNAFTKATQYANKWAKAWHKWALFNTAVMSHYTLRGFPDVAAQFVAAAVTGYFHSIACAANSKGVDDSLQVSYNFCYNMKPSVHVLINLDNIGNDEEILGSVIIVCTDSRAKRSTINYCIKGLEKLSCFHVCFIILTFSIAF